MWFWQIQFSAFVVSLNHVLQNLFCPYKTDFAWANQRSRFAMHLRLGFLNSWFYGIMVYPNRDFFNSWFYAWPFGFAKWPKRPAKPVSGFPNQDFPNRGLPKSYFPKSRFCEFGYACRIGFADSAKIPAKPESVSQLGYLTTRRRVILNPAGSKTDGILPR